MFRRGGGGKRITAIYSGSRGHGRKVWGYSYEDIAKAAGMQPDSVRVAASRGKFDPSDLASVVEFISERKER